MWEIVANLVDMLLFGIRSALLFAAFTTVVINFRPGIEFLKALFRHKTILHDYYRAAAMFLIGSGISVAETMRLILPLIFPHKWVWDFPLLGIVLATTLMMIVAGLTMKFIVWAQEQQKHVALYIAGWSIGLMVAMVIGVYASSKMEPPKNISPIPPIKITLPIPKV